MKRKTKTKKKRIHSRLQFLKIPFRFFSKIIYQIPAGITSSLQYIHTEHFQNTFKDSDDLPLHGPSTSTIEQDIEGG